MDQDVKDILVDGDQVPDVTDAITKATAALKEQLASKEAEVKQYREQYDRVAKMADERGQDLTKAQTDLQGMTVHTTRAEHAAIANALAAAEAEAKSMQGDLASAIETADGKRAAELQVKIAELAARRHTLEQGKERIEEEIAKAKDAPAPQPRQPVGLADPYEAMIAPLPATQRDWLRKHKDKGYVEPGKQPSAKLLKAYYGAQDAGLREDSAAFLVYMDRILGHSAPAAAQPAARQTEQPGDAAERFADGGAAKPQATQVAAKRVTPAAPPSRTVGSGGGGGGNGPRYQLTREQTHTARRMSMTDAEYVAGIQIGIQRGKYPADFLKRAE